jgi:hypothetical protein
MRRVTLRAFVVVALALAVGLGLAVSPYASSSPDGLQRVAARTGFVDRGRVSSVQRSSPIPDYAFPGIHDPRLATGVAGFVGVLGVFAVALGLAHGLRRIRASGTPAAGGGAGTG